MARPPSAIDQILGLGETPDQRYEIRKDLWWLTPKGLAEPEQVTKLLAFPSDRPPAPLGPPTPTWGRPPPPVGRSPRPGYDVEYEGSRAFLLLRGCGYVDGHELCECLVPIGTMNAFFGRLRAAARGPDDDDMDVPPAPSSDPACQLALDSPPHQVIALGLHSVLRSRWRPPLSSADLADTPLHELAGRLEAAYRERWAPPCRATDSARPPGTGRPTGGSGRPWRRGAPGPPDPRGQAHHAELLTSA